MAYPTICPACLAGNCANCQPFETPPQPEDDVELRVGGWFCVCGHGAEESDFVRGIREELTR